MKQLYPLIALLILAPLFSKAQSNYKPGFIVSLKGDTTYGFINYREWKLTPNQIDFKTAITDAVEKKLLLKTQPLLLLPMPKHTKAIPLM